MTAVLPVEVYEARTFWIVLDADGATWVVRHGAVWAQRKPYHGGVRGVQRVAPDAQRLIIQQLLDERVAAAA